MPSTMRSITSIILLCLLGIAAKGAPPEQKSAPSDLQKEFNDRVALLAGSLSPQSSDQEWQQGIQLVKQRIGVTTVSPSPLYLVSTLFDSGHKGMQGEIARLSLQVLSTSLDSSVREWRFVSEDKKTLVGVRIETCCASEEAISRAISPPLVTSRRVAFAIARYTRAKEFGDIGIQKMGHPDSRDIGAIYYSRGNVAVSVRSYQGPASDILVTIARSIDKYLKTEPTIPSQVSSLEMKLWDNSFSKASTTRKSEMTVMAGKNFLLTLANGKAISAVNRKAKPSMSDSQITRSALKNDLKTKTERSAKDKTIPKTEKGVPIPPAFPSEVQIRATYAEISLRKDGKHRIKFLKPGKQTVKLFYLDKSGKVYAAGELKVTVQPDPNAPRRGVRKPTRRPADSGNKHTSEKPKSPAQPKVSK